MRAITGYAVWFWAMLHAGKGLENRRRADGREPMIVLHRGPLLLHTSQTTPPEEYRRARQIIEELSPGVVVPEPDELIHGHVIGRARAVGHVTAANELLWGEDRRAIPIAGSGIDLRWKFDGSCALVLEDRTPIAPIPCRGYQGLWTVPDDVLAAIGIDAAGHAIVRRDPRQMTLPFTS